MSATFASRKVDLDWISQLELLEVNDPPKSLPGATVRRVWTPDERLNVQDAKSTDKVCYYESVAAVRDKKTLAIYVVFRETMDAILAQQKDPDKYPKWLMEHPVKGTERKFYLARESTTRRRSRRSTGPTRCGGRSGWPVLVGPVDGRSACNATRNANPRPGHQPQPFWLVLL